MKIDVILSAEEAKNRPIFNSNVVVIDVLRATSVMVTAIAHGISRIYPYKTVEEVQEKSSASSFAILCGERKGYAIPGFHCGNSPLEFVREDLEGKEMYMTTSNGTQALQNIQGEGNHIWIASFLNLKSLCDFLKTEDKDCVFLCAGTENSFSLDDALCAGMIICELSSYQKTDLAIALEKIAISSKSIEETLSGTKHYEYLKSIGFSEDLKHCCSLNKYPLLLEYQKEKNYIEQERISDARLLIL